MPQSHTVYLNEDAAHDAAIRLINEEAFGPGRFVRAAERLREQGPHCRELSFVAMAERKVVGSVRLTPVWIGAIAGHLLGPLAVRPDYKNLGIGRELVRISLEAACRNGSGGVLLVGDPPYYQPLGFKPVPAGVIAFPGPVDLRRVLVAGCDPTDARLAGLVSWRADDPGPDVSATLTIPGAAESQEERRQPEEAGE
ncbi:GNAT family N-acetyltransferase [Pararhizobium haloflavum]|uniref:GNAT family N-acetyltransferase n=1 Tax=Pararhizobium haloflavum TaxID=2037914 RepID=UPI000C1A56C5|nr:N-acetyltransferase [Pararhizobium haloflavum]